MNVLFISTAGLTFAGSWPHVAAAGTWDTIFYLVGTGQTPAQARFSQFGDNGNPLSTILNFVHQTISSTPLLASWIDRTISPNSLLVVNSTGLDSQPVQIGSAQLATAGKVDGFAIFRLKSTGQEAAVPLETATRARICWRLTTPAAWSWALRWRIFQRRPPALG